MGKREAQFVTLRQLRDGSRQRRLPLLLPDAQPRAAARFRPRARQVAHQRESGVLHPVRARARRERHEAARRARPQLRRARRGSRRSHASAARRSRRVLQRAHALSGVRRAGGRSTARRTRWCTTCASSPTSSTPTTTPQPFIVEDAALRNARLALVLGVQQVLRNGLDAARRVGAGEHVSAHLRAQRDSWPS